MAITLDGTTGVTTPNIGIGTSSPAEKLSVEHSGDVAIEVKSTGTGDADASVIIDAADTGEAVLAFRQDGVAKAAIEWFSAGSPDFNFRTEAGTNGVFDFQPNNSLAMRIDSSGNVGIGTANPTTALDVDGTVTATSYAGDGSALTGIDTSPPTTFGAVGTYGLFRHTGNNVNVYAGSTYSGSILQAAGATTGFSNAGTTLKTGTNGSAPSGTWRAMGTHDPNGDFALTVYVRIS